MAKIFKLSDSNSIASNCYILKSSNEFCVIDPSFPLEEAVYRSNAQSLTLKYIILTHTHYDHMIHLESYLNKNAELLVSPNDANGLTDPSLNLSNWLSGKSFSYNGEYKSITEGDVIEVGDEMLRVIETPGHTAGSVCLVSDEYIFTGDTIFSDGVYGRFDLPGGSGKKLLKSLKRLANLNENLIIYSGHGDNSTIGQSALNFK